MCFVKLIVILSTISVPRPHTGAYAYSSKVLRQIQSTINHGKYHKILPPGAIKIIGELRINHGKISISSCRNYINSINTNNLTYIKITDQDQKSQL